MENNKVKHNRSTTKFSLFKTLIIHYIDLNCPNICVYPLSLDLLLSKGSNKCVTCISEKDTHFQKI